MSDDDDRLRSIMLSHLTRRWKKVAMVFAQTLDEFPNTDAPMDHQRLDRCLAALIEDGLVEGTGNISNWRWSEIRLVDPD